MLFPRKQNAKMLPVPCCVHYFPDHIKIVQNNNQFPFKLLCYHFHSIDTDCLYNNTYEQYIDPAFCSSNFWFTGQNCPASYIWGTAYMTETDLAAAAQEMEYKIPSILSVTSINKKYFIPKEIMVISFKTSSIQFPFEKIYCLVYPLLSYGLFWLDISSVY